MAPTSSPSRRGYGGRSPNYRKQATAPPSRSGSMEDMGFCTLDPKGHKEKLPRPLTELTVEAIYNTESEKKGAASPSKTPSNGGGYNSGEKNASRRYLWSTIDAVMLRPTEVASNLPVPLAAVCSPFADGADSESVALTETGKWGPIRCTRCRCYGNPYFQWSSRDSGRLLCNFCGHHVEVPEGFIEEMDRATQNGEEHPEFVYGSIDYPAPPHIDLDRPQQPSVPATCFVVECTTEAVRSGFFHSALRAIECILEGSEAMMKRRVSLVTFNEAVYFYERTKSGGFRMVTMCDLDDPFVPLSPQDAFVDIGDEFGCDSFKGLLQHLQGVTTLEPESVGHTPFCSVAGTALQVCVDAVAQTGGGDVCIFHASTPSAGLGAMQPVAPEGCNDIQQEAFYQEMLNLCIKGGVAVSTVVGPAATDKLDLNTLQWLSWRTGGDALHLPNFNAESSSHTLASHLKHWARKMQASAYGCIVKLRCSKGLQCESLVAPWPAASSSSDSSAFELPRLTPDTSFAFTLKPDFDNADEDDVLRRRDDKKKQLFVQMAVLYTNGEGERFLRIHTTLISVVFSVRAVYQSVSVAPLVALMLKQAALMALDHKKTSKVLPKDHLTNLCLQILSTYRRHCYTSDTSTHSLVVSKSLCLFPLYILAARKMLFFGNLDKDEACRKQFLMQVLRMPIHSLLVGLYPRAHALPVPSVTEGAGDDATSLALPDSCSLERALATPCPVLQEHVAKGPSPAYIIANGFGAWLLKTESGNVADEEVSGKIAELATQACDIIQEQLQPSASPIALSELPLVSPDNSWQDKVRLATLFVEDEGAADMSYVDWVEFLQGHIMPMLH